MKLCLVALVALVAGCSVSALRDIPDAGTRDSGAPPPRWDAAVPDAGRADAGRDAGIVDAGRDAGLADAGADSGSRDAGSDAGSIDSGPPPQCTSGPCCTGGTFAAAGTVCAVDAVKSGYWCHTRSTAWSVHLYDQTCSGTSAACDGPLVAAGIYDQTCDTGYHCQKDPVLDFATCVPN